MVGVVKWRQENYCFLSFLFLSPQVVVASISRNLMIVEEYIGVENKNSIKSSLAQKQKKNLLSFTSSFEYLLYDISLWNGWGDE